MFKINPEWKMEVALRHDSLFTALFLFLVLPKGRYTEDLCPYMCFLFPVHLIQQEADLSRKHRLAYAFDGVKREPVSLNLLPELWSEMHRTVLMALCLAEELSEVGIYE